MLTTADLDALVSAAGADPVVLDAASDACEECGDPRAGGLRAEAAWWRLPGEDRWRWVMARLAARPPGRRYCLRLAVRGCEVMAGGGLNHVRVIYPGAIAPRGMSHLLPTRFPRLALPVETPWVWFGDDDVVCAAPDVAPAVLAALRAALAAPATAAAPR
jgi:hypothetical protein